MELGLAGALGRRRLESGTDFGTGFDFDVNGATLSRLMRMKMRWNLQIFRGEIRLPRAVASPGFCRGASCGGLRGTQASTGCIFERGGDGGGFHISRALHTHTRAHEAKPRPTCTGTKFMQIKLRPGFGDVYALSEATGDDYASATRQTSARRSD
ncbi:unnamed protein product [Mesocestoides corti]|uniref:Uncharacterized protein n=1 Tax=Mesocestoides corti TaxID=53468 RepID=A0A0R3UHV7_MESCO|nr:unnamed protein product [Mesocestoides corti]